PMTVWLDCESLPSSREGMNNGVAAPAAICNACRRVIFRWDFMGIRSLAIDKDGAVSTGHWANLSAASSFRNQKVICPLSGRFHHVRKIQLERIRPSLRQRRDD